MHNEPPEEDIVLENEPELAGEDSELARLERKAKRCSADLAACVKDKQEYLDGWQRARAELQNLRKGFERDRGELQRFSEAALISDLLTVLDSFQMAFKNKAAWEKVDESWRRGVEYIHQQLLAQLTERGLAEETPLGEPFDPSVHESVGEVESADPLKDGTVAEVHQSGYRLHGKVLRPAKVTVAHATRVH